MKRFALSIAALLVVAPAAAQVATVPVHSLSQGVTPDTAITISVTLYGFTTQSQVPRLLTSQTAKLAPISLLQPEIRAEFPGFTNAGITVMQLVLKTTADAPTFRSTSETTAPKQPLAINVPPGKKLWVVYSAPDGKQANLRFYVGTPPPGTTTATAGAALSGTRISQIGQAFTDSAGNKWSLAPPNPSVEGGRQPVILRNGVVFGSALELVWQNGLVYARNQGNLWYSIGPLETSMSAWRSLGTAGPA